MVDIAENLKRVQEKIFNAAQKIGRKPEDVTLIAVSKLVEADRINLAIDAGVKIIGENKVQEAQQKRKFIKPVTCHMVGHLQRNKVKDAIQLYDMIQSVDSLRLANELEKRCGYVNKIMPILIEVNTSGEPSKYGCDPEEALDLIGKISELKYLQIKGLMTIGLFSDDQEAVRPCFKKLRELSEKIKKAQISGVEMSVLSMGMTSDFELAIEEGSNMVRIGTAIFGPRQMN